MVQLRQTGLVPFFSVRHLLWIGLLVAFPAYGCTDRPTEPRGSSEHASTSQINLSLTVPSDSSLEDRYIVVFKEAVDHVPSVVAELTSTGDGILPHYVYEHTIKGFAATIPEPAVSGIRDHPLVAAVYSDARVQAHSSPASWGLDRTDQRELPLDDDYQPINDGSGVNVYVLDGGIWSGHNEFIGRVSTGHPDAFDALRDTTNVYYAEDCWEQDPPPQQVVNGHGTHVAGTVGGSTYGISGSVHLTSVRVLNCHGYGTVSSAVAGVEWVTVNHSSPAVANMSLGMPASDSTIPLEQAIASSVDAEITYIVSAGNVNDDACNYSPGWIPETFTVGATELDDTRWTTSGFASNVGDCVDIFAPGDSIVSAFPVTDGDLDSGGKTDLSGTSMAAPHVTGVAALYLQDHPGASPAQVYDHLAQTATVGELNDVGAGSPNLLAFTPPPLTGSITGPSEVQDSQTYTWESVVDGGTYSYSYGWSRGITTPTGPVTGTS